MAYLVYETLSFKKYKRDQKLQALAFEFLPNFITKTKIKSSGQLSCSRLPSRIFQILAIELRDHLKPLQR